MRYYRSIKKENEDHYLAYIAVNSRDNVIDSCEIGTGSTCAVGADDWVAFDDLTVNRGSYRDLDGLLADGLLVGVLCRDNEVHLCGNGYSLTNVDVEIFSAFLTISDPAAPILATPTGDGWTKTGWVKGTLPLAVASMDNTGIAATRVWADGSVVATLDRVCSYDRPRPCEDEPVGAVGLPTAGLADGVHAISVGAVDAAGNVTKVDRPQPIKVDNNAPAAPVGLVSPAPVSAENRFDVHWSLPVDAGSPIVAARYQVCQAGVCGVVASAPSLTGIDGLQLPAAGDAVVSVWLVDELGQESPASAAQLSLRYVPEPGAGPSTPGGGQGGGTTSPVAPVTPATPVVPSVPQDPPRATPPSSPPVTKRDAALKVSSVRFDGQQVMVKGSISARASGRVTVRFTGRAARHRKVALMTRPPIRSRRFSTTLKLPRSAAGLTSGTLTITYAGDADTRAAKRTVAVRRKR